MKILFGPAGSSNQFKESGHKSTIDLPKWLKTMNLDTMEYACGRGFMMGEAFAQNFGKTVKKEKMPLSLHAPYYINLATEDPEKQEKTLNYLKESLAIANLMGADRIVFHPGGASKGRENALVNAEKLLARFLKWMDKEDPKKKVKLGVETHGTKNQLGNLDEIIALCKTDVERMLPVIDWAHLYAVANGGYSKIKDYQGVLERLGKELGDKKIKELHMHFSAIEYGPSGELRHRTFSEKQYGPDKKPLLKALINVGGEGRLICECAGTQDTDALVLKEMYESMIK